MVEQMSEHDVDQRMGAIKKNAKDIQGKNKNEVEVVMEEKLR